MAIYKKSKRYAVLRSAIQTASVTVKKELENCSAKALFTAWLGSTYTCGGLHEAWSTRRARPVCLVVKGEGPAGLGPHSVDHGVIRPWPQIQAVACTSCLGSPWRRLCLQPPTLRLGSTTKVLQNMLHMPRSALDLGVAAVLFTANNLSSLSQGMCSMFWYTSKAHAQLLQNLLVPPHASAIPFSSPAAAGGRLEAWRNRFSMYWIVMYVIY